MRVLFVDLTLKYVNPTRVLYPRLLAEVDAVFFGPGYVSSGCLALGVESFVRKHGKFDVVLASEHIVFADSWDGEGVEDAYFRNYNFRFPKKEISYRKRLLNDIRCLALKKVALTLESDYYNFSNKQIQVLDRDFDYVVGWNDQFISRSSEIPTLYKEPFSSQVNDNWLDFVIEHRSKIIPLVHFLGDNEFFYCAIAHRRADFCVPGTQYAARRAAVAAVKAAGCSMSRPRPVPIAGILARMGMRPLSWNWFLTYYQESFREEIRQARMSFTCGSALRWPIRKFFEIPALGSVLLCQPCNGFDALGFRNGVNAVTCDPTDVPRVGRELLEDLERAQAIADAGRRLISECHTVSVRARQFRNALEKVLEGGWSGGRWVDGRLEPVSPT
jgi:hypothetical protein